jgi:succinate dehydrogenase / fumarate reductase, membrane anchor subunit
MTTTETTKRVDLPKTFDQTVWTWMRYSAFLLIPLAWGHIILQDVIVGVHHIDLDYVQLRWGLLSWRLYDTALLGFAFAHGMNGLRQVLRDFIRNAKVFQIVSVVLLILWFLVTVIGAIAVIGGVRKPM